MPASFSRANCRVALALTAFPPNHSLRWQRYAKPRARAGQTPYPAPSFADAALHRRTGVTRADAGAPLLSYAGGCDSVPLRPPAHAPPSVPLAVACLPDPRPIVRERNSSSIPANTFGSPDTHAGSPRVFADGRCASRIPPPAYLHSFAFLGRAASDPQPPR